MNPDSQTSSPRPAAWEDDLSRNALDQLPFENLPPVTAIPLAEYQQSPRYLALVKTWGQPAIEAMIARDQFPIPAPQDREGYSAGFDLDYWLSGLEDYLKVNELILRHRILPRAVFDFGCASGRVIRHFVAQSDVSVIWGSDINARHVRWLLEFMPDRVRPIFNHSLPTLPLADQSIDVVTAFSVFTHIDTFETCWLAEMSRILRHAGLAYVTVHDDSTWELLRDQVDNPQNRLMQSILQIDPTVAQKIHKPLADTRTVYRYTQVGPYRAQVFHSRNYLHHVWGRFFQIEEILPGHHNRQTVLVLRKK